MREPLTNEAENTVCAFVRAPLSPNSRPMAHIHEKIDFTRVIFVVQNSQVVKWCCRKAIEELCG